MDPYYNEYYFVTLIFVVTTLSLYTIIVVFTRFLPHNLLAISTLAVTTLLYIIMFLLSYSRTKIQMAMDLVALCQDIGDQNTIINIQNPIYITLSFVTYYLRIFIQTIILLILAFLSFYIFYKFVDALCRQDKVWNMYTSGYRAPIHAFSIILQRMGFIYVHRNSFPKELFSIISLDKLKYHLVPFSLGLLAAIVFSLIMLCKDYKNACKTVEEKQRIAYKFHVGILTVVSITVILYLIQFGLVVKDML